MALDPGDVRIGVAFSDPLLLTAQAHSVLSARRKDVLDVIAQLAVDKEVGVIVVGHPLNMNGSKGERARHAQNFAQAVRERTGLPVELVDERLTTVSAHSLLSDAHASRKRRKSAVDTIAAALILETYLAQRGDRPC
jgi:putative Holliday junction resolvase